MNDLEKAQAVKAFEKKYKGRRGFKNLFRAAQRVIYHKDILQPQEREFGIVYKTAMKNRQLIYDAVDRKVIKEEKKLDEAYRQKTKGLVTLEEKTLKELQLEHPTMIKDEDIVTWKQ